MPSRPESTDDLRFFDARGAIDHGKNRLPHWDQSSGTYFVTFRLADSIPQEKLALLRFERTTWLTANPPPHTAAQERDYHDRFTARVETWLDAGEGKCALRDPVTRAITARTLSHFDGQRHWLHAWVVMPNHVHALLSMISPHTLEALLKIWKGFSARETNRLQAEIGAFWMKDYFDRLVRDATHFWRCARYIRRNPEKARLKLTDYTLFESSFVHKYLNAERTGDIPVADFFPDPPWATGMSPLRRNREWAHPETENPPSPL